MVIPEFRMSGIASKTLSVLSQSEESYNQRQSLLWRDLELLLDLNSSALRSSLLGLPRELRDHIFEYVIPEPRDRSRQVLHTCFWGADMIHDPWSLETFGYAPTVLKSERLNPNLLLINHQLHAEILQVYLRRSKLTLHAELRNSKDDILHFSYSPHVLRLTILKFVTHVCFYVEWNYIMTKAGPIANQIRMVDDIVQTMETLLAPLQAIENIKLSILFFWKYKSGRSYRLPMKDLFDLEDVFKQYAEDRWLQILRKHRNTGAPPNPSAGVGYKLSTESSGTESGGMEIYVSQNLEDAMQDRRKSNVDYYGIHGISDPLPQPSYIPGAMI
jgi:hypothetical protein